MILYLDSKKLCKFLSDKNPDEYYYVLISDNIVSDGKFDNVSTMPTLTPLPSTIRKFYNNGLTEEYQEDYIKYLGTNPEAEQAIAVLIRAAVKDDFKLIIVNTPSENTSCYLQLLADFIEFNFGLRVYSWKEYKKNPARVEKPYSSEEKEKAMKGLEALCKHLSERGHSIEHIIHPEVYIDNLRKLKKKDLRKYCNLKNIALYGDEEKDKDAMISKIMKRITIC